MTCPHPLPSPAVRARQVRCLRPAGSIRAFVAAARFLVTALTLCTSSVVVAQVRMDECSAAVQEGQGSDALLSALDRWSADIDALMLTIVDCDATSPFASRRFQFRMRMTPLASLTLVYVGDLEPESRVGIPHRQEYAGLGTRLSQCLQATGGDARPDPHPILDQQRRARRVRVAVESDGGMAERVVTGEQDPAAVECIDAILDEVHRVIGPLDPGWPWADPAQWGMFQTATDLPALLWVDGWPTGRQTPVRALPLRAGTHVVQWFDPSTGRSRQETVRIEAGVTTQMDVSMP